MRSHGGSATPGRAGKRSRGVRAAALLGLLLLAGCKVELFNALPEGEANEMLSILLRDGLSASKSAAKDGTDVILVEQAEFAPAVELLRARGFPKLKFETMGEVFQPSGLVASPIQERARLLWALSQELSGTVSQIDGVLTARVQVVLPDNDLLNRDPTPSSASVFIRYDDGSDVTKLVPQIKMLVADSVQGLSYDKVSVILVAVPHAAVPLAAPRSAASWFGDGLDSAAAGGLGLLLLAGVGLAFRRRIAATLASVRPPRGRQPLPEAAE